VLQTGPGQYDRALLEGLDYALFAAAEHGVRVVLVLADNWASVLQYLDWSDAVPSLEQLVPEAPRDEATGEG